MMSHRNWVTFKSEIKEEPVWSSSGDIAVPGGRILLGMLSAHFTHHGFAVSPIDQHEFYGWAFDVRTPQCRAWCLIQGGDPWLLIIEDRRLLQRFLGIGSSQGIDEILDAARELLEQDLRFSAIRWLTRREYEDSSES